MSLSCNNVGFSSWLRLCRSISSTWNLPSLSKVCPVGHHPLGELDLKLVIVLGLVKRLTKDEGDLIPMQNTSPCGPWNGRGALWKGGKMWILLSKKSIFHVSTELLCVQCFRLCQLECHHTVNQTQAIDFKSDFNSEVKLVIDLIRIAFFTVHVPYVIWIFDCKYERTLYLW